MVDSDFSCAPLDSDTINFELAKLCKGNPKACSCLEKIHVFESVDSTNILARQEVQKAGRLKDSFGNLTEAALNLNGSVFIAEHQSAGRGRLGRSFYSPAGTGLYISLVYVPKAQIENPALVTACAAVGVCRGLKAACGVEAKIKWVNDLFYKGKKICGILTEGVLGEETNQIEAAVVGIGVNICESVEGFPLEIAGTAGSLFGKMAAPVERNVFAANIVYEVFNAMDATFSGSSTILDEYRTKSLFVAGQQLVVFPVAGSTENSYKAFFSGIDNQARLVVALPNGSTRYLNSGEVSVVPR